MIHIGNQQFEWGSRTYIMGIVNITPDSFSGDGLAGDIEGAVEQALRMEEEGADIIDIGGESTRPAGTVYGKGAAPVSAKEELERVIPVIQRLADQLEIPISIDTYKSEVAEQAIAQGAALINDVWGLQKDERLAELAARHKIPLILVHNQVGYTYHNLIQEIIEKLQESKQKAMKFGVSEKYIIVDPGIGFGKKAEHSIEVIRRLDTIKQALQNPLLLGASRKAFIGKVLENAPPEERLEGTAATTALGIAKGTDIIRVHDVKEMTRVAKMSDTITRNNLWQN